MRKFIALLLILGCTMLTVQGFSQDKKDSVYRVETVDGNEYVGKLLSRDARGITLSTAQLGTITINSSDIKTMALVGDVKIENGRYYFDNPQSSKYFFTQNGYGVKKGEGYYSNTWIFLNEVTYGVTDFFSISAGTIPLFLFGVETPVWINPKLSIPVVKDKVNIGLGAYVGTIVGLEGSNFAFLYGNTTFGSRDKNLTIGLGWAAGSGEISSTPLISVSGMIRTGQKWYIISENYYISNSNDNGGLAVLSVGARYAARKVGLDFGLFAPIGEGAGFFAAPWLGVNLPFGRKSK